MIRALIDRGKCQTRRTIKPTNSLFNGRGWTALHKRQQWDWANAWVDQGPSPAGNPGPYLHLPWLAGDAADAFEGTRHRIYPRVQPGDFLWVRETWADLTETHGQPWERLNTTTGLYERGRQPFGWYRADGDVPDYGNGVPPKVRWRPGIHMFRWASRLTLRVTDVRIERVQDITEEDAMAEGVMRSDPTPEDIAEGCTPNDFVFLAPGVPQGWGQTKQERQRDQWWPNAIGAFRLLWNHINGPDAWGRNDWCIAISFETIHANVDKVA